MMRIISGSLKGRRIQAPKNLPTRPTTDMAKESLFNILNNYYFFDQLNVIDLFSGTGNISYEFASRGAKQIIAVDESRKCTQFIDKTKESLNIDIESINMDAFSFLDKTSQKVDVIFADPPYSFDPLKFKKIVDLTFENDLLFEEGMLIIEHSKHTDLSEHPYFSFSKKYGGTVFSFFEDVN